MPLSLKDAYKILSDYQCTLIGQTWSHQKYRWPLSNAPIILPKHKELAPWTAKSFIKMVSNATNISTEEIIKTYQIKF